MYSRRYYGRRTGRRYSGRRYSRRYTRKKPSVWNAYKTAGTDLVKRVSWLAGKVALLNTEIKNIDYESASTSISQGAAALAPISLSPIAQGDGPSNRDGNSVKCTNLNIKLRLGANSSGNGVQQIRVIVLRQNYTDSHTVPQLDDILDTPSAGNWTLAHRNLYETRGYKIFFDKNFAVSTSFENAIRNVTLNFPITHHIKFDDTTATDITYGNMLMFVFCDSASNTPTSEIHSRLRFVDN